MSQMLQVFANLQASAIDARRRKNAKVERRAARKSKNKRRANASVNVDPVAQGIDARLMRDPITGVLWKFPQAVRTL